jgi:hypothetical protein
MSNDSPIQACIEALFDTGRERTSDGVNTVLVIPHG